MAFAKASIGEQPKESTYGAFAAVVKRHGIGGLFHGLPTRSVLHAVVWCVVGAGREFCEWAGLRETCFIMVDVYNVYKYLQQTCGIIQRSQLTDRLFRDRFFHLVWPKSPSKRTMDLDIVPSALAGESQAEKR